jgi:hypothetical protein
MKTYKCGPCDDTNFTSAKVNTLLSRPYLLFLISQEQLLLHVLFRHIRKVYTYRVQLRNQRYEHKQNGQPLVTKLPLNRKWAI